MEAYRVDASTRSYSLRVVVVRPTAGQFEVSNAPTEAVTSPGTLAAEIVEWMRKGNSTRSQSVEASGVSTEKINVYFERRLRFA